MRRVHGEATECVMFIGRQRMRRVHWEATECVGANRLGRNGMRGRVHREGLDGTGDGNEAWRTAQRRKWTSYIRNGVLLIGRGVAYRKTEETDLVRSEQGPIDREWCGVPQNGGNGPPTVETGVLLIGRGVAYRKTGLHGIMLDRKSVV